MRRRIVEPLETPASRTGREVRRQRVADSETPVYAFAPYLEQKLRTERLFPELEALELKPYIADLAMYGYAVVPQEELMPASYVTQLHDAVLKLSERRTGVTPDADRGTSHATPQYPRFMRHVLFEDPVFEPMITHPILQGLVSYLVGSNNLLSLNDAMVKGPGEEGLPVHNDHRDKGTAVFPEHYQAATVNVLLSDYDEGCGAIAFLPGSHTFRREPTPEEMRLLIPEMKPVYAPAGSAVVWHVNTWHTAFPRTRPGLRVTLLYHYCRGFLQTQSSFRDRVRQEILDRNPPRFAQLLNVHGILPFGPEGVDRVKLRKAQQWHSLFDCHPLWKSFFGLD